MFRSEILEFRESGKKEEEIRFEEIEEVDKSKANAHPIEIPCSAASIINQKNVLQETVEEVKLAFSEEINSLASSVKEINPIQEWVEGFMNDLQRQDFSFCRGNFLEKLKEVVNSESWTESLSTVFGIIFDKHLKTSASEVLKFLCDDQVAELFKAKPSLRVRHYVAFFDTIENCRYPEKKNFIFHLNKNLALLHSNKENDPEAVKKLISLLNLLVSLKQNVNEQDLLVQIQKDAESIVAGLYHHHEDALLYNYLKQMNIIGLKIEIEANLAQEIADRMLEGMASLSAQEFLDTKCIYERVKDSFTEKQYLLQLKKDQPIFTEKFIALGSFNEALHCVLHYLEFHPSILKLADKLVEANAVGLLEKLLEATEKLFDETKKLSDLYLQLANLAKNEPVKAVDAKMNIPVFHEAKIYEKGARYIIEHFPQAEREEKVKAIVSELLLIPHEDRWKIVMDLMVAFKVPPGPEWEKVLRSMSDKKHAGRRAAAWTAFKEIYKDEPPSELRNILLNRFLGTDQCDPELIQLIEEEAFVKSSFSQGDKILVNKASAHLLNNAINYICKEGEVAFSTLNQFRKQHCPTVTEKNFIGEWIAHAKGNNLITFFKYFAETGLSVSFDLAPSKELLLAIKKFIEVDLSVESSSLCLKLISSEKFKLLTKNNDNKLVLHEILQPALHCLLSHVTNSHDRDVLIEVLKCYRLYKELLLEQKDGSDLYMKVITSIPLLLPVSLEEKVNVEKMAVNECLSMEKELLTDIFDKKSALRGKKQYLTILSNEVEFKLAYLDRLMDMKMTQYAAQELLKRINFHFIDILEKKDFYKNFSLKNYLGVFKRLFVTASFASKTKIPEANDQDRFTTITAIYDLLKKKIDFENLKNIDIIYHGCGQNSVEDINEVLPFKDVQLGSMELIKLYNQNPCFGNFLRSVVFFQNITPYLMYNPNETMDALLTLFKYEDQSIDFLVTKSNFFIQDLPLFIGKLTDESCYRNYKINTLLLQKWEQLLPSLMDEYLKNLIHLIKQLSVSKHQNLLNKAALVVPYLQSKLSTAAKKGMDLERYQIKINNLVLNAVH
jgi:predicted metallopeptidase